jgi:hypothetical protein
MTSAAVELGTAATLLIADVSASIGRKQTLSWVSDALADGQEPIAADLPTCSAFSQLRFILDWLSGPGKGSS